MDVFDLVAKIRLDSSEYEQGVGKAKGTFSNLASGVKTGLATVAKVGAAAVTAGAAGVTALTKMGVEGYAQYEQLVGGVETLFKTSSNAVMGYAENAYKTAGMSSNQYMETVTSFSASLIQSLGGDTAKAAEVGNMAITDMSDNANKMGTSMEMIQNAYQGFAKQNYTMLDNLKLGYGGTKEEMQRLIDDANKVKQANGEMADLSIDSFADVTEAIHIIQTEMGITGTTAKEASSTIEGSVGMMKGAWENLVVGMADSNADMGSLIDDFVESAATAAQNLLPRIEQALVGIGQLITELAPVIAEALPLLVEAVLPSLVAAGVSLVTALVNGIIQALPAMYTALLDGVQIILVQVFGVSEAKAGEFANGVNSFFSSIGKGFHALVESAQTDGTWLNETWTWLKDVAQGLCDILVSVWDAISAAFSWCVEQINTDGTVLNLAWENIAAVASAVWEIIKSAISTAISVIKDVISVFTSVLKGDWSAAWDAIKNIVETIWDHIKSTISTVINAIKEVISNVWNGIKSVTSNIWNGIKNTISSVWDGIKSTVSGVVNSISNTVSNVFNGIKATVSSIWSGILTAIKNPIEKAKNIVKADIDAIKGFFSFKFEWPKLKLPHFGIKPKGWKIGDLLKGSIPKLSIDWYKKAYGRAMVLSSPTIFGYSSASGKLLGGGDGNGNEIVAGETHLMNMIGKTVERKTAGQNERIISLLTALLSATIEGNDEMVRALLAGQKFVVGDREFARLVRTYA